MDDDGCQWRPCRRRHHRDTRRPLRVGRAWRAAHYTTNTLGAAFNSNKNIKSFIVSNDRISQAIQDVFDMRPAAIIERLNLLRPIYRATAAYGHFGHAEFPWEASDRVVELQRALR